VATFVIRYEHQWERDLKREGLYGPNFDTFWREVEESIDETPNVGYPILDGSGASGFLTHEGGFFDLPKLVIYFKVDWAEKRLVFLGLDSASTAEDFPPAEWGQPEA
jgi:hypothetical protein